MVSKRAEEDIERPSMQDVSVDVRTLIYVAQQDLSYSANTDLQMPVSTVTHTAAHNMVQTQGTIICSAETPS